MDKPLVKLRHERSLKDYPKLHLEGDEYVVLALGRAQNSLLLSWIAIAAATTVVLIALLLLLISEVIADDMGIGFFLLITMVLAVAAIIAGIGVATVHYGNKIYFTNQRLIQTIVNFPLLEDTRSINLSGINKVSYSEASIVERLLHYGTLKISTHEKNVMVLENQSMKSALDVFKDSTDSVFVMKDVQVSAEQLDEINQLISDAPKLGHKVTEEHVELNTDIKDEINEQT